MVKTLPAVQETQVWSLVGKSPRRREWQPPPVLLPRESHGQRSLAGYSPWGHKELDTTELVGWSPLSKCYSIWKIWQISSSSLAPFEDGIWVYKVLLWLHGSEGVEPQIHMGFWLSTGIQWNLLGVTGHWSLLMPRGSCLVVFLYPFTFFILTHLILAK